MYKVLIVDDQEILRYDIKRMKVWSQTKDFVIAGEAENGMDALKKLRASSSDLLITDIKMPVIDGMELLKTVSEEKLCPCVVLLSDYTEFAYARKGLLHGAFDYLGKPVDNQKISELLSRVKVFLDQKRREKEKIRQWEDLADKAFFPDDYVNQVAVCLIKAQEDALSATNNMLATVGAALDYDLKKAVIILENASSQIISRVLDEHGWIKLYTDVEGIRQPSYSRYQSWDEIRKQIYDGCSKLLNFLKKFVIWKEIDTFVKSACLEVLYNIDNNISVKTIAENLFISKAYLSERFKKITGISLSDYIYMAKIERAKYLLISTSLKNYEIAETLGYKDHEYFSKVFKKSTGLSPTVYRKENISS